MKKSLKNHKIFSAILVSASLLCTFGPGASAVFAKENTFQPEAVSDDWKKVDTKGTYASFQDGDNLVNIYKYDLKKKNIKITRANEDYEACYQTFYSQGDSLYVVTGLAKDAEDIGSVREMVEHISYPGNPSLDETADEDSADGSDSSSSLKTITLLNSDGETVTLTQTASGSDTYKDDIGVFYTSNGDGTWSDEYGNLYKESENTSTDDSDNGDSGDSPSEDNSSEDGASHGGVSYSITVQDSDGNQRELSIMNDGTIMDGDGNTYSDNNDESYSSVDGTIWRALNDDTHYLGSELATYDLKDADGNIVTVTQTTNGDYLFRDSNGTGFTDNGDGTWTDANGNLYTE